MDKGSIYATLAVIGLIAGAVGITIGLVYGIVTVAKWAWNG